MISGDSAHYHQSMNQVMPVETDYTLVDTDCAACARAQLLLRGAAG
jgi:hypothetical protein